MQNLVSPLPRFLPSRRLRHGEGAQSNESASYHTAKRLLDLVITLSGLFFLWPLCLLIALWIKLDSPGPVFFVQERVGARRRELAGETVWELSLFKMYKFRSMKHKADQSLHVEHIKAYVNGHLQAQTDQGKPKFKLTDDPRVTGAGRFLRKTSLDELPQLINVLKGEMSLVGPRPVPLYEVELYREEHFERLTALPGVTGLWQVDGRGDTSFAEMMRLDACYVRTRSIGGDLWILLKTIPAALLGGGAA
jgi:lipopolysaccharide/colanic/teichoic acid biosynthesis glycosyltransferase